MPIDKKTLAVEDLNALIERLQLTNAMIVKSSTEQLTFKQLAKAREGKTVTLNIQRKITNAIKRCVAARSSG